MIFALSPYFCCWEGTTLYCEPDDWALWMGVWVCGDMGGQLRFSRIMWDGESGPHCLAMPHGCECPVHTLYTVARQCSTVHLYSAVHTWLTMGCCLVSQTWALLSRDLALARITFPIETVFTKITSNSGHANAESKVLWYMQVTLKWQNRSTEVLDYPVKSVGSLSHNSDQRKSSVTGSLMWVCDGAQGWPGELAQAPLIPMWTIKLT